MPNQKSLSFTVGLALIAWFEPAHAGRIHYEKVPLKSLARSAETILVVKPLSPLTTTKKIPFDPKAPKFGMFHKTLYHFRVVKVLAGPKTIKPKTRIKVETSNWSTRLHVSRLYKLKGIHKSPLYRRYPTEVDLAGAAKKKRKLIIFVFQVKKDTFRFETLGAWEEYNAETGKKVLRFKTTAPSLPRIPAPGPASPKP